MVVFMVYSPATNTLLQVCPTTDQERKNKRDFSGNMSHIVDWTFQQLENDSTEAGLGGRVHVSIGDITFLNFRYKIKRNTYFK